MPTLSPAERTLHAQRLADEDWFALARKQSPAAETMARAIEADDAEGVRSALEAGLPVDSVAPVQQEGADARGYPATWLEHALLRRQPKVAALDALLTAGADPLQLVSGVDRMPAALAAISRGNPQVVAVFRRHGSLRSAFSPVDHEGWGPLAYALGSFGIPELPISHPAQAERLALVNEMIALGGEGTPYQKAQVLLAAVNSALPAFQTNLQPLGIRLADTSPEHRAAMRQQAEVVKRVWGEATHHDPATRTSEWVRPDKGQGWLDALDALPETSPATPRRRRAP